MQPVAADQREEGGQEGAALRACAAGDHVGKLVDLESEERRPEHERHHSAQIQVGTAPFSERRTSTPSMARFTGSCPSATQELIVSCAAR